MGSAQIILDKKLIGSISGVFYVPSYQRGCDALFFGGGLLDDLLPTGNISQEDFDFYFGAEAFVDAGEFWDVAPGFFPHGFPPHLKLPYPREKTDREEDSGHRS